MRILLVKRNEKYTLVSWFRCLSISITRSCCCGLWGRGIAIVTSSTGIGPIFPRIATTSEEVGSTFQAGCQSAWSCSTRTVYKYNREIKNIEIYGRITTTYKYHNLQVMIWQVMMAGYGIVNAGYDIFRQILIMRENKNIPRGPVFRIDTPNTNIISTITIL